SRMATLLATQQFFDQVERDAIREEYAYSGLGNDFEWNGIHYEIINPYNIEINIDGTTVRHQIESDSGEFPNNSTMTNVVSFGGNAYLFCEDNLWCLKVATLRWERVPIEANGIAVPLTGFADILRVVDSPAIRPSRILHISRASHCNSSRYCGQFGNRRRFIRGRRAPIDN
ncbi:hypothetical protein PFISCL1PPCAC_9256, partial [Pristionchus fissidentatus]